MAAINNRIKATVMRIKRKKNKKRIQKWTKSERERYVQFDWEFKIHNLFMSHHILANHRIEIKILYIFQCTIKSLTINKNQDVFNQCAIEFIFRLLSYGF